MFTESQTDSRETIYPIFNLSDIIKSNFGNDTYNEYITLFHMLTIITNVLHQ